MKMTAEGMAKTTMVTITTSEIIMRVPSES